jgi:hypothetical protein
MNGGVSPRRWRRTRSSVGALSAMAIAVVAIVVGCGGNAAAPAVVRVGRQIITKPMVAHRQSVLALGGRRQDKASNYQTLRQQAVAQLIAADWLIGEAAAHRRPVPKQAVDQQLRQQESTYPNKSEFTSFLKVSGKAVSDMRLEIEAELAAESLRRMVISEEAPITQTEIVSYYAHHHAQYTLPELRTYDIVNNLTSAQASKLKRQVAAGKNFSRIALHESLEKFKGPIPGEKATIVHAIFAARAHVLSGPEPLLHANSLFEVTNIRPAKVRALGEVQEAIRVKLAAEQRRRAIGQFISGWMNRWIPKTDCIPGYVVFRCKQYAGPRGAEVGLGLE